MTGETTNMVAESFSNQSTCSVQIQTDFRESETQTDPYSPEYVIKPGSCPELLTLAALCYGKQNFVSIPMLRVGAESFLLF